jgi:hypothetical protein
MVVLGMVAIRKKYQEKLDDPLLRAAEMSGAAGQ